jgi:hypothetical protein
MQRKLKKIVRKLKKFDVRTSTAKLIRATKKLPADSKILGVFTLVFVFLILVVPIVKISSIALDGDPRYVRLLSGSFGSARLFVLLCVFLLVGRNLSAQFRQFFSRFFDISFRDQAFNAFVLFVLLAIFLTIGDVVALFTETARIQTSSFGYAFLLVYLLVWFGYCVFLLMRDVKNEKPLSFSMGSESSKKPAERILSGRLFDDEEGE